ncbi:acyltransferase [uncultured Pseudosulfitobacter sp.]|uniref:acyltransferase family protein n=1 Tax=uncultured Pseudosulfitobacter sp. TaxID=2854214 RepID=UPI0030DC8F1E|tara:strand:+ start:753 stop:1355 length:603 start_codon:yes stop_codon:yes gene_type:complete
MQRFTEIEGIRGILAFIIVLYHYGLNTIVLKISGGIIENSHWGNAVDFFFVISGFVLGHSQNKQQKTWGQFSIQRAFRLLPPYLALFILYIAFEVSSWEHGEASLMLSTIGLSYMLGMPQWNGVSWSMSVELYLPILFFGAFFILKKRRILNLIFFAISLLCCSIISTSYPLIDTPSGLLRGLFGIGLGITLFLCAETFQ